MSVRGVVVTVGVGGAACLAAVVISASPAEAPSGPQSVAEAPSETFAPTPRQSETHPDRQGARKPLKASPSVAAPESTPKPRRTGAEPKDIRISYYKDCSGDPQPCIDAGSLTKYGSATPILAGHNYDGYAWLATVPEGKRVIVVSGPLAGTYKVYDHMQVNRRGGAIPNFGRADLVLQTCVGTGSTGFSLAERV